MNLGSFLCLLAILLWMSPLILSAQGSCVIPTLKVTNIKGRIVTEKFGLSEVNIGLKDWKEQTTLRKLVTDEEGNFNIRDIKRGKYFLFVNRDMFSSLQIPIDLDPKRKNKGKTLLIHLAPDFKDACSEGGVELVLVSNANSAETKSE